MSVGWQSIRVKIMPPLIAFKCNCFFQHVPPRFYSFPPKNKIDFKKNIILNYKQMSRSYVYNMSKFWSLQCILSRFYKRIQFPNGTGGKKECAEMKNKRLLFLSLISFVKVLPVPVN